MQGRPCRCRFFKQRSVSGVPWRPQLPLQDVKPHGAAAFLGAALSWLGVAILGACFVAEWCIPDRVMCYT